ncbi:hypothetical protein RBB50_012482 [Rhinocladiella similis]
MPANPNLTVEWGNVTLFRNKPDAKTYIANPVQTYRDTPSSAAKAIILTGPHSSRSDPRPHITVRYLDRRNQPLPKVTHVHLPRDAPDYVTKK